VNSSHSAEPHADAALNRADANAIANANAVLAREAGEPFQPPLGKASGIDPITEWLSLMEVVHMLCPMWPVRDKPMQGNHWRL
jgi:hypothetical protein